MRLGRGPAGSNPAEPRGKNGPRRRIEFRPERGDFNDRQATESRRAFSRRLGHARLTLRNENLCFQRQELSLHQSTRRAAREAVPRGVRGGARSGRVARPDPGLRQQNPGTDCVAFGSRVVAGDQESGEQHGKLRHGERQTRLLDGG